MFNPEDDSTAAIAGRTNRALNRGFALLSLLALIGAWLLGTQPWGDAFVAGCFLVGFLVFSFLAMAVSKRGKQNTPAIEPIREDPLGSTPVKGSLLKQWINWQQGGRKGPIPVEGSPLKKWILSQDWVSSEWDVLFKPIEMLIPEPWKRRWNRRAEEATEGADAEYILRGSIALVFLFLLCGGMFMLCGLLAIN